jgi:ubiquinone/menaquinone biosynthesis C-methylase UbiE
MALTKEKRLAPPMRISGLLQGQWANRILRTAVELDLFTALKVSDGLPAADLAAKLKVDNSGLVHILNALVALEFLSHSGDRYQLVELAENYLVKDSPLFVGDYILQKGALDAAWERLTEAVKSGKPLETVNEQESGEEFFRYLTAAIFPLSFTTAQMTADELSASNKGAIRVLDLAAGSGVWSIPIAQSNPEAKVDALDFPGILEVTDSFTRKFKVGHQYNHLAGNWRDIKLEPNAYDMVMLGHILHCEGKELSIEMLKACFSATKPGGTLVIAEFLSNEMRSGPPFAQMFAVNMFVMTQSGCVFTMDELKQMLSGAGFSDIRRLNLPYWGDESPVVVAKKK